jgi:hypothetical protein
MQSIHVVVGGISPTTASVAEVAMETANYTKDRSGYTSPHLGPVSAYVAHSPHSIPWFALHAPPVTSIARE